MTLWKRWLVGWTGGQGSGGVPEGPIGGFPPRNQEGSAEGFVDPDAPSEQLRRKRVEALVNHLSEVALDA